VQLAEEYLVAPTDRPDRLADLRRIRTLSSPEEFFERKSYTYKRLIADLEKNSVTVLKETLTSELLG
jgi:hypothetical protein